MALSGKTISCKQLIGEIYRDVKYKYELPYSDSIEWCVDAIQAIGAPSSLTPKVGKVIISNYRGMLPCDLDSITQTAGSFGGCAVFPMTTSTHSFHPVHICDNPGLTTIIEEFNTSSTSTAITEPIGEDISGNPVYEFQNGNMSMPETTSDNVSTSRGDNSTYNTSDNYIFTNFSDGCVFIAYDALPVDDEGFPTIPDNKRFKDAVKSYIRYKIDYILWRNKELDKDMFEYSEREWLFYVASAGNVAKMPGYDQMQGLLNQMKLIPNKYAHSNFFRTLNQ